MYRSRSNELYYLMSDYPENYAPVDPFLPDETDYGSGRYEADYDLDDIDPNHYYARGNNPYAFEEGKKEIRRKGQTSLHHAVEERDPDIVLEICKKRRDLIDMQDKEGWTALRQAVWQKGFTPIVKILLEAGANARIQDSTGMTALHVAVSRRDEKKAKIIINHDGVNNIQDKCGKTVLHWAVGIPHQNVRQRRPIEANRSSFYSSPPEQQYTSYRFNCDPYGSFERNLFGVDHNLSLRSAAKRWSADIAKELNADQYGELGILKRLLFCGVHPHMFDNEGRAPLQLALQLRDDTDARSIMSSISLSNIRIHWEDLEASKIYPRDCKKMMAECNAEVLLMKKTKVPGSTFSYHDVVTKHVNKLALFLQNDKARKALLRRNATLEFPIYAEWIAFKVKKAETRRIQNDRCLEFFIMLCEKLPSLEKMIILNIFAYLNEPELQNFLRIFKYNVTLMNHRRRSLCNY